MQARVISRLLLLTFAVSAVSSANILDLIWTGGKAAEKREEDANAKTCACNGPSCMCCVDFNMTYIDLGGPGCVQMRYISQEEGLAVNVSYGDSLLHSEQVKGPDPEPTCMSLLVNLAQVCARFSNLLPHNDGLRGCLLLEPKLLGEVTSSFNIGCFTTGPGGMVIEKSNTTSLELEASTNSTETESEGINEEELIAVVNESAEQGLAFFGNLLGLAFGKPETNSSNTETVTSITTPAESSTAPATTHQSRKLKELSPRRNEV